MTEEVDRQRLLASEELANLKIKENEDLRLQIQTLQGRIDQMKSSEISLEKDRIEFQQQQIELQRFKNQYELSESHLKLQIEENQKYVTEIQETRKAFLKRLEEAENKIYAYKLERNEQEANFQASEQEKQKLDGILKKSRADYERLLKEKLESEFAFQKEREAMQALVENYKSCEAEAQREKTRALSLAQETENTIKQMSSKFEEEKKQLKASFESQLMAAKNSGTAVVETASNISPSVAEEMLKNRGLTLTSLYSDYVKEKSRGKELEDEVGKLNEYLNKIVEEVEQQAPALFQARIDYERVLSAYDEVSLKLNQCLDRIDVTSQQLNVTLSENSQLRDECSELKAENEDLANQIRSLLSGKKSGVSQSQNTFLSTEDSFTSPPRTQHYPRDDSSVQAVISENLVTFSNVAELQAKNQQLIRLVRRLEAQIEKSEDGVASSEQLNEAMNEIERMRESRQRQEELVKAIVVQRDMYRSLLAQADSKHSEAQQEKSEDDLTASGKLSSEFQKFKAETKLLMDQLNSQLRDRDSKLHEVEMKLAKATAENNSFREEIKAYSINTENLKNDKAKLSRDYAKAMDDYLKVHRDLAEKANEIQQRDENVNRLKTQLTLQMNNLEVVENERKQLNALISSVTEQKETTLRQLATVNSEHQKAQNEIINLKSTLRNEAELAEKYRAETTEVMNNAKTERDSAVAKMEIERAKWEKLAEENSAHKENLAKISTELEILRKNEASLKDQLEKAMIYRHSTGTTTSTASESTTNISVIADLKAEVERVKEIAEQKAKDAETFRSISAANEDSLKHATENVKRLELELERKTEHFGEERAVLKAEYDKATKDLQTLKSAHSELERKYQEELSSSESRKAQFEEISSKFNQIQGEARKYEQAMNEANENYNRELQLHSSDVTRLTQAARNFETSMKQVDELRKENKGLKDNLERKTVEYERSTNKLNEEISRLKVSLDEFQKENASLQQFSSAGSNSSEQENHLQEVIRMTSKQRDRLMLEKDSLEIESKRASAQLQQAKSELANLREELNQSLSDRKDHEKLLAISQENLGLRGVIGNITKEQMELREKLNSTMARLESAESGTAEARKEFGELEARYKVIEREKASKEHENKLLQERLTSIIQRIGSAEEFEKIKHENNELLKQKDDLEQALKETKEKTDSLEKIRREQGKLAKEKMDLENSSKELKEKLEQLEKQVKESKEKSDNQMKESRLALEKIRQENLKKDQEISEFKKTSDSKKNEDFEKLKSEKEAMEKDIDKLKTQADKNNDLLNRFRVRVQEAEAARVSAEAAKNDAESKLRVFTGSGADVAPSTETVGPSSTTPEIPSTTSAIVTAPPAAVVTSEAAQTPAPSLVQQKPEEAKSTEDGIDLEKLKIQQLRKISQKLGIPMGGESKDLVNRLKERMEADGKNVMKIVKEVVKSQSEATTPKTLPTTTAPEHVDASDREKVKASLREKIERKSTIKTTTPAPPVSAVPPPSSTGTTTTMSTTTPDAASEEAKARRAARFGKLQESTKRAREDPPTTTTTTTTSTTTGATSSTDEQPSKLVKTDEHAKEEHDIGDE